jgi:hypothetical protein
MINYDLSSLFEKTEFKSIKPKQFQNLKSIIMTGGIIYVKDNLNWCSESHYSFLKERREGLDRTFLGKAEEKVIGPMLKQTSRGIRYE